MHHQARSNINIFNFIQYLITCSPTILLYGSWEFQRIHVEDVSDVRDLLLHAILKLCIA